MRLNFLILLFLTATHCVFAESEEETENTGQDFTRPITRVDFRYKYQEESEVYKANICTLRADKPFSLPNQWILSTRLDLPYAWIHGDERRDCNSQILFPKVNVRGLTDVLVQGLFIAPPKGKWTFAFGMQMLFPTAKYDALGSGQYRLLPTLAFKYDLKDWMEGAWLGLLVRQDFDVAGSKSRASIQQTYIQPVFNLNFPQGWFMSFFPEMRFDWKSHLWFVPFDIQIGKLVTKKIVLSLEYKNSIVDDFPLYKQEVELRLGYFF